MKQVGFSRPHAEPTFLSLVLDDWPPKHPGLVGTSVPSRWLVPQHEERCLHGVVSVPWGPGSHAPLLQAPTPTLPVLTSACP